MGLTNSKIKQKDNYSNKQRISRGSIDYLSSGSIDINDLNDLCRMLKVMPVPKNV